MGSIVTCLSHNTSHGFSGIETVVMDCTCPVCSHSSCAISTVIHIIRAYQRFGVTTAFDGSNVGCRRPESTEWESTRKVSVPGKETLCRMIRVMSSMLMPKWKYIWHPCGVPHHRSLYLNEHNFVRADVDQSELAKYKLLSCFPSG